jgi:hypothetical protein
VRGLALSRAAVPTVSRGALWRLPSMARTAPIKRRVSCVGLAAEQPRYEGAQKLPRRALAVVEGDWHCESLRRRFPGSPSGSRCFAASPLAPADQRRAAKAPCRSHNPSVESDRDTRSVTVAQRLNGAVDISPDWTIGAANFPSSWGSELGNFGRHGTFHASDLTRDHYLAADRVWCRAGRHALRAPPAGRSRLR